MSKPAADLRVYHSKRALALAYNWPKCTGGMLAHFFEGIRYLDGKTLAEELDARGFDLATLRFQIRKRAAP